MNIEQTIHGDLVISYTDVRTPEDRVFAREIIHRWEIAPVFASAADRLIKALGDHKWRGEKASDIRAALEDLQGYVDDFAGDVGGPEPGSDEDETGELVE